MEHTQEAQFVESVKVLKLLKKAAGSPEKEPELYTMSASPSQ